MIRNELFKKALEKFNNLSQQKILLLSHNDLDGYGSNLILKSIFDNVTTKNVSNDKMDNEIKSVLEYNNYDIVFVTDISCTEETAKQAKMENVILLDHHKTAMNLNNYNFAIVCNDNPEDGFSHIKYANKETNGLCSGSTLLLDFLIEAMGEDVIKEKIKNYGLFKKAIFTIGEYDTWDWYNIFNDKKALDFNRLFYTLESENFIKSNLEKFKNPNVKNLFSLKDKKILDKENKKTEDYIKEHSKRIITSNQTILNKNYTYCFCKAEKYITECFEYMKQEYKDVDFYMIDTGVGLSLRSIKDNIDVSEIAKAFGGGGHAKAAGINFTKDNLISFVGNFFYSQKEKQKYEKEDLKNVSIEQIAAYTNFKFNNMQMTEIRLGLQNGLSKEQVSIYAKPEFDYDQIKQIREGLEYGLSIEQVKTYANPELNYYQMREIKYGFENNLSKEQISVYNNPEFNNSQMEQIRVGFQNGLSIEQISLFAKPEFNLYQMIEIRLGFKNGLSEEQISVFAKPEFNADQMIEIKEGLQNGLSIEQVSIFAKPEIDDIQMFKIRCKLEEDNTLQTEIDKALNSKDAIEKDAKSTNKDSIDREER